MDKLIYFRANENDITAVTDLLSELFETSQEELLEEFANPNQAFFLAQSEGKPVGALHVSIRREYVNGTDEDLKGYLEGIYVLPEYRLNGVAAELVKISERWMQMNGCREMASDCLIENIGSYNFHLKIGFEETERCIFFSKGITALNYEISQVDDALRKKLQPILDESWAGPYIAVGGKLWDSRTMSGYAALNDEELIGYLLYELYDNDCEIMVLESLAQNIGVATALIEQVKQSAKMSGANRLIVRTTNDNIYAFRFYQRRGFKIHKIQCGEVAAARKLKPSIPLIGNDNIPICDEIIFMMEL